MNKQRRKRLEKVIDELDDLAAEIGEIDEEESDAYDNLPESLQESEKGESMSDNCDTLEEIQDNIAGICDDLRDIVEN